MKENKANDISSLFFFINLRHKNWEKIIRDKQCQKKHEACHALNTNWLQMIHIDLEICP